MNEQKYKATLSSGKDRSGLCLIFRHPLRKNSDGTPVRVRRGLGTKIKSEAQPLLDQMNEILGDVSFWNPQARGRAESLYDERIVSAFFDQLSPNVHDGWALRDEIIPIPGPAEGYARARILGTTGAGKTTLVRQLSGTNPATERFPSTSTAKTTVCDLEMILADEPFKAVVTFFAKERVTTLIEECVLAAAMASVFESGSLTSAASRLLEHSEQRFRLSYVLGTLKEAEGEPGDEDEDDAQLVEDDSEVSEDERNAMSNRIRAYIERTSFMATSAVQKIEKEWDVVFKQMEKRDLDVFQEVFEYEMRQDEDFHTLVDEILDDVEQRFDGLKPEGFRRDRNDWPLLWEFECIDRAEFIRTVNRFSSNYAPNFGKLLTPLVQGIRVRGPFRPDWLPEEECKLVLMDGEGLGHTPDSSSSVSTYITQRLNQVDAVVLVDSAEQPMQAAPQALLRTLAAGGHENKLIVCFTHFDGVNGPNLPDVKSKKQHVLQSLQNSIGGLREVLGRSAENALIRNVAERVFFVSNIQEQVKDSAKMTLGELRRLVAAISDTIIPLPPTSVLPVYDVANLILCIPQAMTAFREPWRARLKLPSSSNISPEHWTRVKALSRRFADLGMVEYDDLRPVADFILRLSEQIMVFLGSPVSWEPAGAPDDMKRQVVGEIARQVFADLHALAEQRLFHEQLKEWVRAYSHRGSGSASERARGIDFIYEAGAPIPRGAGNENTSKFVAEVCRVVRGAVERAGGIFQ